MCTRHKLVHSVNSLVHAADLSGYSVIMINTLGCSLSHYGLSLNNCSLSSSLITCSNSALYLLDVGLYLRTSRLVSICLCLTN